MPALHAGQIRAANDPRLLYPASGQARQAFLPPLLTKRRVTGSSPAWGAKFQDSSRDSNSVLFSYLPVTRTPTQRSHWLHIVFVANSRMADDPVAIVNATALIVRSPRHSEDRPFHYR